MSIKKKILLEKAENFGTRICFTIVQIINIINIMLSRSFSNVTLHETADGRGIAAI